MPLDPSVTLQPHQADLRRDAEMAASAGQPFRRLVVWQPGSGKTTGALAAADALGRASVVSPAAVRPGFKLEAKKVLNQDNYPVLSYQEAANRPDFRPETLVVDEGQNLVNSGSSRAKAILDKAHNARNLILLSATPVRNHPSEMAPLISALTNKPLSHDEFNRRFVGTENVRPGGILGWLKGVPSVQQATLKHTNELKAMLAGKVDYYENSVPAPGAPSSVKYEDVISEMTPRQAQLYAGMMGKLPAITRWKLKWNYPLSDEELMRTRSFFTGPRQLALSDRVYRADRDPYKAYLNSGKLQTAMARLKTKLVDPRAKAIVYSNFPEAGLVPYSAALTRENIPHAIFHGGLNDVQRKQIVSDFNDGRIRVGLIGPSGAEGLSLKGSQTIQLLDPYWNDARMTQAAGRGVRFDSHVGLPEDLRGVTVERHIAQLPLSLKDKILARLGLIDPEPRRHAVDHYLQSMSQRKQRLNDQMINLLREVSVHNRAVKTASERIHAGDAIRLFKLAETLRKTVPDDAHDPADREDCPSCGVMHERGDGVCNSCGELWPAKTAQAPLQGLTTAEKLRLAKVYSDLQTPESYATKTMILRDMMTQAPKEWYVDSTQDHTFGVTHLPSGWRYHVPKNRISELVTNFSPPPMRPVS